MLGVGRGNGITKLTLAFWNNISRWRLKTYGISVYYGTTVREPDRSD